MDRTDEFRKAINVISSFDSSSNSESECYTGTHDNEPSAFIILSTKVHQSLLSNDIWIRKISELSDRKEFSNDPTAIMTETTHIIQQKIVSIQSSIDALKKQLVEYNNSSSSSNSSSGSVGKKTSLQHNSNHYKYVLESLTKVLADQIERYKSSIKVHSEHVNERKKRVVKYGQVNAEQILLNNQAASYAMFSNPKNTPIAAYNDTNRISSSSSNSSGQVSVAASSIEKSQEMRRRALGGNTPYMHSSSSNSSNNSNIQDNMQMKQQQHVNRNRSNQAEKIEQSIAQMGQLFTQMAAVVMEQGETISRIEDDIEEGLMDTIEGHKNLIDFYEITKGNRGMIVKVFLLLILFIFIFLIWT